MRGRAHRRRAVTLLEITLAVGIIVPVMATVFLFYSDSLDRNDQSSARVRRVQLARVIINRITQELRQSTGFSAGYGTGIFGTHHQISINTVVIPDKALVERRGVRAKKRAGQFDLRQVDYYVAWDKVNLDENGDPRPLGLVRRERRTFNKLEPEDIPEETPEANADNAPPNENNGLGDSNGLGNGNGLGDGNGLGGGGGNGLNSPGNEREAGRSPGGSGGLGRNADETFDKNLEEELQKAELEGAKRELYAPEIKYIEFLYHDGNQWWKSWEISDGNALPQMVMVTIGYIPEPPEEEKIEVTDDMLKDEQNVEPLAEDRFMMIVRIPQSDSFFGSRIQREASAFSDLGEAQ